MRCNVVVQTMTIICIKDGNEFVIYECLYNIVFVDVKQGVRTIWRNNSSYGIADDTGQMFMGDGMRKETAPVSGSLRIRDYVAPAREEG